MSRVESRKYRDGSRGQPCSLRVPGICDGGGETTVFAHIRDRFTGRSIKASDLSGCDACFPCHTAFDQGKLGNDWTFYALRGLQETIENREARGLLVVQRDLVREKVIPPRKPAAERRPMPKGKRLESGSTFPPGRKIANRNNLRKERQP